MLIMDYANGGSLYDYLQRYFTRLSRPVNDTPSNDTIYGVIPYIAPEIFKGAKFSKESDIYSLGMIMWELTTGCKPFANVEHDVGLIYEIINENDLELRMILLFNTVHKWNYNVEFTRIFEQSEDKRIELVQSKKFCPKFNERKHPKAIFTSRELSSLISKASIYKPSTNKFSTISFNNGEYISKEYEYDINSIQRYLPY
ncbi:hypothetical protein RclHR1_18710001 [Rhizophagus clarus]|uniref:Protein kinase domain-containing protein n=1 Tax=Rhizophagus clarus TaxID=94130 RepID=A0A2Z6RG00_9GLOM|nr:hypothetical protein RclHR1_18710001 [Rhizophagus clarus]